MSDFESEFEQRLADHLSLPPDDEHLQSEGESEFSRKDRLYREKLQAMSPLRFHSQQLLFRLSGYLLAAARALEP